MHGFSWKKLVVFSIDCRKNSVGAGFTPAYAEVLIFDRLPELTIKIFWFSAVIPIP
jgi:hypothetical protein